MNECTKKQMERGDIGYSPAMAIRLALQLLVVCLVGLFAFQASAFEWLRSENGDSRDGNAHLQKKEYPKALSSYDKAAKSLPNRGEVHLNRGLALSRMGEEKLDEAMQALTLAADSDAPRPVLARAEWNLGNAFFQKQDYKAAIDHYKKSLILQPGNRDVAWNLEVARLKKKQQEQEKKDQENQEQQNQDGDNEDQEKQDQENQDQEKQDQENQDQEKQQQQNSDQEKQDQEQQEPQKPNEPDKEKEDEQKQPEKQEQPKDEEKEQQSEPPEEAQQPQNQSMERMLNALDKEDNDFHKNKAQRRAVGAPAHVKDW